MKKIIEDPREYMFPSYCFTKPFRTYYFFVPRIVSYNYHLLFDFLDNLKSCFQDNCDESWQFFALGAGVGNFIEGDKPPITLNFTNVDMKAPLKEIESAFNEFIAKYGWPFTTSYRIFWMGYQNKIQVYVNDDAEIVVVGVDLEENLIKTDSKIHDNIFKNFGYDGGFSEYANGYGKHLLGMSYKQIKYLNDIFGNK